MKPIQHDVESSHTNQTELVSVLELKFSTFTSTLTKHFQEAYKTMCIEHMYLPIYFSCQKKKKEKLFPSHRHEVFIVGEPGFSLKTTKPYTCIWRHPKKFRRFPKFPSPSPSPRMFFFPDTTLLSVLFPSKMGECVGSSVINNNMDFSFLVFVQPSILQLGVANWSVSMSTWLKPKAAMIVGRY